MKKQKGFTPLEVKKTAGNNKQSKPLTGFTIIELLIVIAIIGVLAAIVLVNVLRYIDKGKDAAAKGDMATLLTNAITFYNENGNFNGVKDEDEHPDYANVIAGLTSDEMGYTVTDECNASDDACTNDADDQWCASVELKSTSTTTHYCVDSSGAKKEAATACDSGSCP